jgi:hypothetical protein
MENLLRAEMEVQSRYSAAAKQPEPRKPVNAVTAETGAVADAPRKAGNQL